MEIDNTTIQELKDKFMFMIDEQNAYQDRLDAYEFLLDDSEPIKDVMIEKMYSLSGDTALMTLELLSRQSPDKAIFMLLVSQLYLAENIELVAKLIGSYGDSKGVEVLKNFADEVELNYNEFMEVRNAIEMLGGDFESKQDFENDPFYRALKGLDEESDGEIETE